MTANEILGNFFSMFPVTTCTVKTIAPIKLTLGLCSQSAIAVWLGQNDKWPNTLNLTSISFKGKPRRILCEIQNQACLVKYSKCHIFSLKKLRQHNIWQNVYRRWYMKMSLWINDMHKVRLGVTTTFYVPCQLQNTCNNIHTHTYSIHIFF